MSKPTRLNGSSDFPCHDPKFTLTIRTGNAAFGDNPAHEIEKLLRHIATSVSNGARNGWVYDNNRNPVGEWSYDV